MAVREAAAVKQNMTVPEKRPGARRATRRTAAVGEAASDGKSRRSQASRSRDPKASAASAMRKADTRVDDDSYEPRPGHHQNLLAPRVMSAAVRR